jgi:SAM-dependent methyltransferase
MAERYTEYDTFAWFYNRYWGSSFTDRFLAVIEKLLLSHLSPGARILDLCCGTGQLAQLLGDQGFQVAGIDGSEAMLAFARTNAPGVEFTVADARAFTLPPIYHGAVSSGDSLNHLMTLGDLTSAFDNVHSALVEGGSFLFDLNMEEGYRARWRGSFAFVEDENVCAVRGSYDPDEKVGRFALTMFRLEEGSWRRSDLTLLQRCYSQTQVESALAEAGFRDVSTYDVERDLGISRDVGRTFFLARKERRH